MSSLLNHLNEHFGVVAAAGEDPGSSDDFQSWLACRAFFSPCDTPLSKVYALLSALAIMYSVVAAVEAINTYVSNAVLERFRMQLRREMMERVIYQDLAFLQSYSSSEFNGVLGDAMHRVSDVYGMRIPSITSAIMQMGMALFLLSRASPGIALMYMAVLFIIVLFQTKLEQKQLDLSNEALKQWKRSVRIVSESFTSIRSLKSLGAEYNVLDMYEAQLRTTENASRISYRWKALRAGCWIAGQQLALVL
ncbi:unnamed protein product, partial [Symbiodinium sp. KB8]